MSERQGDLSQDDGPQKMVGGIGKDDDSHRTRRSTVRHGHPIGREVTGEGHDADSLGGGVVRSNLGVELRCLRAEFIQGEEMDPEQPTVRSHSLGGRR